jgi:hypothetical protein
MSMTTQGDAVSGTVANDSKEWKLGARGPAAAAPEGVWVVVGVVEGTVCVNPGIVPAETSGRLPNALADDASGNVVTVDAPGSVGAVLVGVEDPGCIIESEVAWGWLKTTRSV